MLTAERSPAILVEMKRFLIVFGAAFTFMLCLSGIILIVRQQRESAAIRQQIADGPADLAQEEEAAHREGILLSAQELQQPLPSPDLNAAPIYTKLTKLLHDKPLGLPKYAEGMDAFHTYTPAQIASVRHILGARQDVMTLVHQAADKPQCVFLRDWRKGRDAAWPEFHALLASAWLIKTESYLLARDGNYDKAIADQARGFRVGHHAAAADPVLIEYLLGLACDSRSISGMQSILSLAGPNAAVDGAVQKAIVQMSELPSLRFAMIGETGFDCLAYAQMHQAEKYGVKEVMRVGGLDDKQAVSRQPVSSGEQKRVHNLIDAWEADYLRHMRRVVAACDAPIARRRQVFAALGEQPGLSDPASSPQLASYVLLPVFSEIDRNDTRTRARIVVTLAAASVLVEKANTGTYPSTLPPGSLDPYTSTPLLYHREGSSGFLVYSVGPTGRFDGVKIGEKMSAQESQFRYPPVPVPIPADMLK